jgi:hypothetical protein
MCARGGRVVAIVPGGLVARAVVVRGVVAFAGTALPGPEIRPLAGSFARSAGLVTAPSVPATAARTATVTTATHEIVLPGTRIDSTLRPLPRPAGRRIQLPAVRAEPGALLKPTKRTRQRLRAGRRSRSPPDGADAKPLFSALHLCTRCALDQRSWWRGASARVGARRRTTPSQGPTTTRPLRGSSGFSPHGHAGHPRGMKCWRAAIGSGPPKLSPSQWCTSSR